MNSSREPCGDGGLQHAAPHAEAGERRIDLGLRAHPLRFGHFDQRAEAGTIARGGLCFGGLRGFECNGRNSGHLACAVDQRAGSGESRGEIGLNLFEPGLLGAFMGVFDFARGA